MKKKNVSQWKKTMAKHIYQKIKFKDGSSSLINTDFFFKTTFYWRCEISRHEQILHWPFTVTFWFMFCELFYQDAKQIAASPCILKQLRLEINFCNV